MKYTPRLSIFLTLSTILMFAGCSGDNSGKGGNSVTKEPEKPATYRVNYIGNGNYSGESPEDENWYLPGDIVTIRGNTGNFEKTGYMFRGWNTEPDGTGTTYMEGDTFAMGETDVDLYIKWGTLVCLEGYSEAITQGRGVCADSEGNIYVTGETSGSLNGQSLNGISDMFLIKYDPSGERQWTKLLGSPGVETKGAGICYDPLSNCILVTGYTCGSLNDQTITGTVDMLLIKFDASGTALWTRLLGVSGMITRGYAACIDTDGTCYVTGSTNGDLTSESTGFLAKYDNDGVKQWIVILYTRGTAICVDSDRNCYIAEYNNVGTTIEKYDTGGNKLWQNNIVAVKYIVFAKGICSDKSSNCYVTGYTNYEFGGQTLTGTRDLFLLKYDTGGALLWTKFLGIPDAQTWGCAICIDEFDNTYVTGWTQGNLDGNTLSGENDALVIKHNRYGERIWSALLGSAGSDTRGNAICLLSRNRVYVAGEIEGYDLDGMPITGDTDSFVMSCFR